MENLPHPPVDEGNFRLPVTGAPEKTAGHGVLPDAVPGLPGENRLGNPGAVGQGRDGHSLPDRNQRTCAGEQPVVQLPAAFAGHGCLRKRLIPALILPADPPEIGSRVRTQLLPAQPQQRAETLTDKSRPVRLRQIPLAKAADPFARDPGGIAVLSVHCRFLRSFRFGYPILSQPGLKCKFYADTASTFRRILPLMVFGISWTNSTVRIHLYSAIFALQKFLISIARSADAV